MEFTKIRQLYDIWDNRYGISENIIAENEKRLGIKLPKILREYYLQLGDNELINQTEDAFHRIDKKLNIDWDYPSLDD